LILANLDKDKYDRQYTDAYLYKRIWKYFQQHAGWVWGVSITSIVVSVALAFSPVIIAEGVDVLEENRAASTLVLVGGALLLTEVIRYGVNWIRRRWMSRLVGTTVAMLRKDAQDAAVKRDMAFYDENKSGKILSRITNDTEDIANVLVLGSDIISQLMQVAVLLAVLFTRDLKLTLIILAFMPLLVFATVMFRKIAREATRQGARVLGRVNDTIQETVSGISIAKNFRQEQMIYDEFTEVNNQSYAINRRKGVILALVFPSLNFLTGIATGTVLYLGALYVLNGEIRVSEWYLYIQAVEKFWFPFIAISAFWSQFQQAMSAIERIFGLIDANNTVQQNGSKVVDNIEGRIEYNDITFSYDDGTIVLDDFNLTIEKGEGIAFVGHTGAGKSTVARLIMRFYEFQAGQICVDGQDIRSFDLASFRSQIGFIPQRPFLFSGTIADNIRYSNPQASDDEINEVAHSIGDGEWLETMPNGLNTDVGERGSYLSMGQRQLVSLLRVLLQRPAIFILDEATASIDPFTEMQIQEALDLILQNATSILIAHRLSTVRSADRIIVLENGGIIEQGNHQQLIEQGGHYAELYETYFRHQSLSYVENAPSIFEAETAKRTRFVSKDDVQSAD